MSLTQIKFSLYFDYTHMILYFSYIRLLTRKCTLYLSLVSPSALFCKCCTLCENSTCRISVDEVREEEVGALFVKLVFIARRVHLFVSA